MLCVAIKGPTLEQALHQIAQARKDADLVELRLDCISQWEEAGLKKLRAVCPIPMIFTLRDSSQGGSYQKSEAERLDDIRRLAYFKPEYLDLETHVPLHFTEEIRRLHPEIKLIISSHDFTNTPRPLHLIYEEMQKIPACFYKIAVNAQTALDALRMLYFLQKSNKKVIGMSMGTAGQLSRILGPVFDCPVTYACLDESQKTAPGQLSAKKLVEQYRWRSLNRHTAVFANIEGTADANANEAVPFFEAYGSNAILIRMRVKPAELAESVEMAKALRFHLCNSSMDLIY